MMTLAHDNHPKAAALAAASILILLGSESKDCTLFSKYLASYLGRETPF